MKTTLIQRLVIIVCILPLSHFLMGQGWKYDAKLNLRLNSNVHTLALHPKGGILVGGAFTAHLPESGVQSCLLHFAKEGDGSSYQLVDDLGKSNLFPGTYDAVYDIKPFKREGKNMLAIGGDLSSIGTKKLVGSVAIFNLDDATIDDTFTAPQFDTSWSNKDVHSILPLPNGQFIIAGSFRIEGANKSYISVARLNSDGSLDETFNQDGVGFTGHTTVYKAHLLPDGRILLGGTFSRYNDFTAYRIACLLPDGRLDPSFKHISKSFDWVRSFDVNPVDGSIIIAGDFKEIDGHKSPLVALLNEYGEVDRSFTSQIPRNGSIHAGAFTVVCIGGKGPASYVVGVSRDINKDTGSALCLLDARGNMVNHFLNGFNPPKDVTGIFKMPSGDLLASGTFQDYPVLGNNFNAYLTLQTASETDFQKQGYKVVHETDFEPFVPARYGDGKAVKEQELLIDGIRWRVRNGYIEDYEPLSGRRSLALVAQYDSEKPSEGTVFEMIDPLTDAKKQMPSGYYLRMRMRGQDGLLSGSGWYMAFSLDGGNNWMKKPLTGLAKGGVYNEVLPIEDEDFAGATFKMKIYFEGNRFEQGQRLLLDDLILYNEREYGGKKPTVFSLLNMAEGFRTSMGASGNGIPVLLDINFARGLWDPSQEGAPSPVFDSHIAITIDGKPYTKLYSLPYPDRDFPIAEHFSVENIAPGKHTMGIYLVENATDKPWGPYPEALTFTFESGVALKSIKGLSALKPYKPGIMVKVEPKTEKKEDRIYVSLYSMYRGRRYITDGEGYLLIDDPYGYWPFESEHPENTEYLAAFEGEYMVLDGMPMVRLTARPDAIKDTSETYLLKAKNLSLEEFNKTPERFLSGLFNLSHVSLLESDQEQPLHSGAVYTVKDPKGHKAKLFNQFSPRLSLQGFHTSPKGWVDMLVIGTRNIFTKEIMLAPISWRVKNNSPQIDTLSKPSISYDGSNLQLVASGATIVEIYDLSGALLFRGGFVNEATYPLEGLIGTSYQSGQTLVVSVKQEGADTGLAIKITL